MRLRRARHRVAECRMLLRDLRHSLSLPTAEFSGVQPRPRDWARAEARLERAARRLTHLAQGQPPFASSRWARVHWRFARQPDVFYPQKQSKARRGA